MFKFIVYVPLSHVDVVKQALFAAGAGRIGDYDCCCFQTEGQGQFRARAGANPFLGQIDQIEYVTEAKLELVCERTLAKQAINAMIAAHPYEEPAYQIISVLQAKDLDELTG